MLKELFKNGSEKNYFSSPEKPASKPISTLIQRASQLFDRRGHSDPLLTRQAAQITELEQQLAQSDAALRMVRTELLEAQKEVRYFRFQSSHDGLTTLPNSVSIREYLEDFLKDTWLVTSDLAVLFMDIDNFKTVNDVYGHTVGDEVLQIVAARVKHAIRGNDRVGRLGGDEFLCLIANAHSQESVTKIVVQILEAVSAPIQIEKFKIVVHSSIGISFCSANASTADRVIRQADAAMYRAKRLKLGYAYFDASADDVC
jgi:diguanylate cyclase (GGDEF)-like protein